MPDAPPAPPAPPHQVTRPRRGRAALRRRWWVTAALAAALTAVTAGAMVGAGTTAATASAWWNTGPAAVLLLVIAVLHRRDCRRAEDADRVASPDNVVMLARMSSAVTAIAFPADGPGQLRKASGGHRCPAGWTFTHHDNDPTAADSVLSLPAGWYGHPPRSADWPRDRAWDCPTCGRSWLARPGTFEVRWRREPLRRTRRRLRASDTHNDAEPSPRG